MTDPEEFPVPGVRGLEHTADVGLEIDAPGLPELFLRAALGAMWLVLERAPELDPAPPGAEPVTAMPRGAASKPRNLELVESDLPSLLRSWLRTLLYWEETEGFVTNGAALKVRPTPQCGTADGLGFSLQAQVVGGVDEGPRVREVKGVTLHGLRVERRGAGWYGRVIFDV